MDTERETEPEIAIPTPRFFVDDLPSVIRCVLAPNLLRFLATKRQFPGSEGMQTALSE